MFEVQCLPRVKMKCNLIHREFFLLDYSSLKLRHCWRNIKCRRKTFGLWKGNVDKECGEIVIRLTMLLDKFNCPL